MDKCLIIFIILLLILLWISYRRNYKFDNFGSVSSSQSRLNNFYASGGLASGDGIKLENIKTGLTSYDDRTFDDIKEFLSDKKDFGESGLYKCLVGCNGTCVPYGPTGDAHCFPKD
jgi:hypothetical protein